MQELLMRNSSNQKIIKKYSKKAGQSTKKQVNSVHSLILQDDKENQDDSVGKELEEGKQPARESLMAWPKTNNFFKQNKIYAIRPKPKDSLGCSGSNWNKSTVDLKANLIKSKVDEGFKETKRYQSLGRNILNNIVFDPDNMLAYTKRRIVARNS